jgi:C1A family cysteine protease
MLDMFNGWLRDNPDPRDFIEKPAKKRGVPGDDIDLRKTGWLPPVYQQYQTQSCTAMALGAAIEYIHRKEGKPELKPSKLFMYWNARVLDDRTEMDGGAELRSIFKAVNRWGVAPNEDFPFIPENLLIEPPEKAYINAQKEILSKYSRVKSTRKDIVAVLSRQQPIVFGAHVFENFRSEKALKTGIIDMPEGSPMGGHAMLLVGIRPDGLFIVRNSFGAEMNDRGYCYFPQAYIENDNLTADFWTLN